MADGRFVLREKYCWLVAGGWFVLREKYCWLVADKPSEQAFSWLEICQIFATFSTLSPSHHIKYTKRHMFGAVNVGKKIN
jgi:hypothetical protein